MSQQHVAIWQQCAEAFDQRYQAISEGQWETQTPCADWNVQQLVEHAVGTQAGFCAPMVGADIAEGADWPAVRAAIDTALADPSALEGTTEMPGMGTVPKGMIMGIAATDILVHAWDLARAIGADEQLPAEAVSAAYGGLQQFPPEMMRQEGFFGPAIEGSADADEQTQMLRFAGREV